MNQRKVANLVIYNIFSRSIKDIYKKHKKVFEDYKSTLVKLQKEINDNFRRGSIKYYHDTRVFELVDPFLLEKTGEDFNYWMIEINESIMRVIDALVDYSNVVNDIDNHYNNKRKQTHTVVDKGKFERKTLDRDDYKMRGSYVDPTQVESSVNLARLKVDLEHLIKTSKSTYQIDKEFLSQGPKITANNDHFPYRLGEWYKALEFAVNNFQDIEKNLDIMLFTIKTLDASVDKMKIKMDKADKIDESNVAYDDFMDENMSEADFMIVQQKLFEITRNLVKRQMEYGVIRFGNYKKQCEFTLIDLRSIDAGVGV